MCKNGFKLLYVSNMIGNGIISSWLYLYIFIQSIYTRDMFGVHSSPAGNASSNLWMNLTRISVWLSPLSVSWTNLTLTSIWTWKERRRKTMTTCSNLKNCEQILKMWTKTKMNSSVCPFMYLKLTRLFFYGEHCEKVVDLLSFFDTFWLRAWALE